MGLGSEIRDPEKTYSGSRIQGSKRPRIQGSKRHRIPDPDPQRYNSIFLLSKNVQAGSASGQIL
jgi:hypothetical protein